MNLSQALYFALFAPAALAADNVSFSLKGAAAIAKNAVGASQGQSDDAPGQNGNTPGQSGNTPGQSDNNRDDGGASLSDNLTLTFINHHPYQVFGNLVVMVHDQSVGPLYAVNEVANDAFATLCTTGNPAAMVAEFSEAEGVSFFSATGVLLPQSFERLTLPIPEGIPEVGEPGHREIVIPRPAPGEVFTATAMIAKSNDGCVILNAVTLEPGATYELIEIDAGVEENIETCETCGGCPVFLGSEIRNFFDGTDVCPCGDIGQSGPQPTENAEGFMSLHTGVGLHNTDLFGAQDWRSHMVTVTVSEGGDLPVTKK